MDLEDQYDKLYRYCYFRVRDVQTAEDLVQETFLRWLDHYPGQREREALPTLYTIARNLCVDVTRQREPLPLQETPQDQELLLLRYANQVPLQALSRLTGLSRFAIYRRCGRLLTQLREALREEERT